MFTLSSILIILGSIIMILIVLAQNSKGGGLSSTFGGGGGQVAGVQQTNKFLDKATWGIAIALLVFSITASLSIPRPDSERKSAVTEQMNQLNQSQNPDIASPDELSKLKENTSPDEDSE